MRQEVVSTLIAASAATFKLKNQIFIALIVISNTVGNLLLGIGMNKMPDFFSTPLLRYAGLLMTSLFILMGTLLLIIWMLAQLSMFTWADLTYVLPVTASAYVLTAILSKFFLDERISLARWAGVGLISLGVIFVSETPVRSHKTSGRANK